MFRWSSNAAHIQSLFRPWNAGDGWDESKVVSAEQSLSISFPPILRNFYLSWGKRSDYTRSNDILLDPQEVFEHYDHIVFGVENQAVMFWGIARDELDNEDPPVQFIYNESDDTKWKPSHSHLSDFLDALLYHHAFAKGAIHGASINVAKDRIDNTIELVKHNYSALQLDSSPWGMVPPEDAPWTLYIKPGIAIDVSFITDVGLFATSQAEESLQELEDLIGMKWEDAW